MKKLFKIKAELPRRTVLIIELSGLVFFLFLWWIITFPFQSPVIEFNATKGVAPYSYKITGTGNYEQEFGGDGKLTGMNQGEYTIALTDAENNKVQITIPLDYAKGDTTINKTENNKVGVRADVTLRHALVDRAILPSPGAVLGSFSQLHFDDFLVRNTLISLKLNVLGYLLAIISSLLIGFLIGLIPFFRSLLSRYIDAIRFIPLAAVTGIFIAWFGIETNMKVQFLAFGIFVFLVPVVVQRIDDVQKIYTQTAYTLGATGWQTIRNVYWPHVTSKIIDDIRVLTAISWTYIIVAELVNTDGGGIGAMIFKAQRVSRLDKVFALLLIIVLIGFIQDRLFVWIDRKLYPHKRK